jgi:hypothetical protein
MVLPAQAEPRVLPQPVLSSIGPGVHSLEVPSSSQRQCALPLQSSLVLHELLQACVASMQVPPQGHWVSA